MGAETVQNGTWLTDANTIADALRLTTAAFGNLFGVSSPSAVRYLSGQSKPVGSAALLMAYISCAIRRASDSQIEEMRRCVLSYPPKSAEALAALLDLCAMVRAKTLASLPARPDVRQVTPGKRQKARILNESKPLKPSLWVPKEGVEPPT